MTDTATNEQTNVSENKTPMKTYRAKFDNALVFGVKRYFLSSLKHDFQSKK